MPFPRLDLPARWVRAALFAWIAALVALAGVAFLTMDAAAWRALRGLEARYLLLALGLALIPWITMTLRIRLWSRFAGADVSAADALRITLAGDVAGAVAPTLVGGSAVKLVMLTRRGLSAGTASALVAWMTVEDALFFALFLPPALMAAAGPETAPVRTALHGVEARAGLVLGAALLLALIGVGLRRRSRPLPLPLRDRLAALWRDARLVLAQILRRGKLRAAAALGLTAVQWLCRYSVIVAVLAAFGVRVAPLPHVLLQWVVFTAGSAVPTPGGAGAVEAAFAVLYQPFVPAALLAALTATWRLAIFYVPLALALGLLGLLFGGPAYRRGRRSNRTPASATASNEV